eukprot:6968284-Pyramimonas_sp.AAC.1
MAGAKMATDPKVDSCWGLLGLTHSATPSSAIFEEGLCGWLVGLISLIPICDLTAAPMGPLRALLPCSRQLAWDSVLDELEGIREASTSAGGVACDGFLFIRAPRKDTDSPQKPPTRPQEGPNMYQFLHQTAQGCPERAARRPRDLLFFFLRATRCV